MCRIGSVRAEIIKNRKGVVIQRLWVFEFSDQVSDFRDVSDLQVPPNVISRTDNIMSF